jgi:tetratricopeptide (TPR) repeat protein
MTRLKQVMVRYTGICAAAGFFLIGPALAARGLDGVSASRAKKPVQVKTDNSRMDDAEEKRVQALSHYALGIVSELNNDTAGALDAYYESALQDPSHEALVIELARRLLQAKQTQKVIELLQRAGEVPGTSGNIHAWLGVALAQAGRLDAAIRACRTAIQKSPDFSLPYQTLAEVRLQQEKPSEAVRVLRQAFEVPHTTPDFLLEVVETAAHVRALLPKQDKTLKSMIVSALERAREADPDAPLVLQRIGDAYRVLGEYDKAAALYLRLLERFSKVAGLQAVLRERLIDTYLRAGNKKEALKLLDDMLRETPTNAQAYMAAGALLVDAKEYATATDYFDKALLLNPAFEPVYFELAGLRITMNEPQKALELLAAARDKFARSYTLELYTALAYSRMKDYSESLKYFTAAEVVANATEPKRLNHAFYFQLGATFERSGDFDQAEKYFRKCLELSPSDAEAMNYMGYMWAEKGIRLEEARLWIEKALKLDPDNAAYLDSMGWVLFKLNQPRSALNYLLKAVATSDEPDATIHDHLGDVRAALRQWNKAVGAWQKSLEIEASETIRKKLESAPLNR